MLIGKELMEPSVAPVFIMFKGHPQKFVDCNKFTLYVDGVQLFVCTDVVEAFLTYLSTYYVFSLSYSGLAKTMYFMEKVVLGLCRDSDKQSKEEKVVSAFICQSH